MQEGAVVVGYAVMGIMPDRPGVEQFVVGVMLNDVGEQIAVFGFDFEKAAVGSQEAATSVVARLRELAPGCRFEVVEVWDEAVPEAPAVRSMPVGAPKGVTIH